IVPSPEFATHTAPPPKSTAIGAWPTGIVMVEFVAGSMRVTTSSPRQATQTAPAPYAIATGCLLTPVALIAPSWKVAGSKRWTVASPEFATQMNPPPTTSAAGAAPVSVEPAFRAVAGRIFVSVESPKAVQTASGPSATLPNGA